MRIAVLSDMHAVAGTYRAALRAAEAEGFDALVILGDLLTYGVDPREVIELTDEALARHRGVLVLGNHDQMYLDRRQGRTAYLDALPDWIRETVDWTCEETDDARALEEFAWTQEWVNGRALIAHANPYAPGDWRYLAACEDAKAAGAAIADRGLRWGIFGHTHRFRRFDEGDLSVFTLGSLGQPRDPLGTPEWAMVELSGDRIEVSRRRIPMDREAHRSAIQATSMSQATKDRLCAFFP